MTMSLGIKKGLLVNCIFQLEGQLEVMILSQAKMIQSKKGRQQDQWQLINLRKLNGLSSYNKMN
jgi:hypothetical protein